MQAHPGVLDALREAGVQGIDSYVTRLLANRQTLAVYEDFLSEGFVALMFADSGFAVKIRESPDIALGMGEETLFAEVKRFRRKMQDDIDEVRMRGAFVRYGDTEPTEGATAWDQVASMARRKAPRLRPDAPNLIVIHSSSSYCIEDGEVLTAAHILDEELAEDSSGALGRLSGLMLLSLSRGPHGRVFFFELLNARLQLSPPVRAALGRITDWRTN